jgi:hypothetical protein
VEEGGGAENASDGDEKEGVGAKKPGHADKYSQSDVDLLKLKTMKKGGGTVYINDENEKESTQAEISKHADEHN